MLQIFSKKTGKEGCNGFGEVEPFKLLPKKIYREPFPVRYLFFGYGTLGPTHSKASHYYRLRPYLGRDNDPIHIPESLQRCKKLAQAILDAERRPQEKKIWESLFSPFPTHVVRLGWKSLKTGHCHDILYLPLCFAFFEHPPEYLAMEWGKAQTDYLLKSGNELHFLCPPNVNMLNVQICWMAIAFAHHYWILIEKPLEKYR
jgi:hypothetical protein